MLLNVLFPRFCSMFCRKTPLQVAKSYFSAAFTLFPIAFCGFLRCVSVAFPNNKKGSLSGTCLSFFQAIRARRVPGGQSRRAAVRE